MASFIRYLKTIRKESKRFPGKVSFFECLKYYKSWAMSFHQKNGWEEMPWMTFGVIDFLKNVVIQEMRVFEYGSGSSTLFWAKRAGKVYSVEHDSLWSKNVKEELTKQNIQNVELFLILPEKQTDTVKADPSDPYEYSTEDETLKDYTFEKYVKKIEEYPDEYFDFVIVDGRSRPSCIAASISKVKTGGYLLLDNSEREYYLSKTIEFLPLEKWVRKDFCGPIPSSLHFSQTSIFKKSR
jgi:hypothetical protein